MKGLPELKLLITADNINELSTNGTPLHVTMFHNQLDCFIWLLANGANVDSTDVDGMTPLHDACNLHGRLEYVPLLLAAGATHKATSKNGKTPLTCLCERRAQMRNEGISLTHYDMTARMLLDAGASLKSVPTHQIPWWAPNFVKARQQCRNVAVVAMGVLRVRLGMDPARLIGQETWTTRLQWE